MSKHWIHVLAKLTVALAAASSCAAMAAPPKYKIEVVRGDGALPAPSSVVAINNQNEMVGRIPGLPDHADDAMLARYTGPRSAAQLLPDSAGMSKARINESGQVLGTGSSTSPTIWHRDGSRVVVDQLDNAAGFNNLGHVAGYKVPLSVVWTGTALVELDEVDHQGSTVTDINDAGASTGRVWYRDGQDHLTDIALWNAAGRLKRLTMAGAWDGSAAGINKQGHVAGNFITGNACAFIYDGVKVKCLPMIDGSAQSEVVEINDRDEVLGNAGPEAGPVLWRKGVGYKLRNLVEDHGAGWEYLTAYAFNNAGHIVGWGLYNGKERAFLARRILP